MSDSAVWLALYLLITVPLWNIFTKAGQPGWQAAVPILNLAVLLRVVGRPTWWLAPMIVPLVGAVVAIVVTVDLARSFSKSDEFAVGMVILGPFFYTWLAFGADAYVGAMAGKPIGRHTDVTW